jgi:hypothetical protein
MLMVIFGAGASYDSSPDFLPPYTGGGANARHDVLSGITSEGLESYLNFEDIEGFRSVSECGHATTSKNWEEK